MSEYRRRLGRTGEMVAAHFLQRHGIEILARNVAVGPGELDILARQGTTRLVVEVRTVTGREDPLSAFDARKRAQVARLAHRVGAARVDLVAIRLTPEAAEVRWVRAAA